MRQLIIGCGIGILLLAGGFALEQRQPTVIAPADTATSPSPQDTLPTHEYPSTADRGSSTPESEQTVTVLVYFLKSPASDQDPTKVFGVKRVTARRSVAAFAVEHIILGPTTAERAGGYRTGVELQGSSNCNGQDFTLMVEKRLATLQFCKAMIHTGILADARAETQLVRTLKQFKTIEKVQILNFKGKCEFDVSDQNSCIR